MGKRIAVAVGFLALIIVAGGGGFFWGRSVGASQANQARQAAWGRLNRQGDQAPFANGTPPAGVQDGVRTPGAGGTMGTIESIEGNTVVVTTQDGSVRVQTTDTTLVQKMMSAGVTDLVVGEQVMVTGSKNDDGSVTARSIQSLRAFEGQRSDQE